MTGNYWKKICAIPAYMFLLSPSGTRVQKMEGGNWIDQHEAQKVVDEAEDELSELRAEIDRLKRAEKNDAIAYKAVIERQEELRVERNLFKAESDALIAAMNEILRVTPMGVEAFGIAALVLGELGVSKEPSNG